MLHRRTLLAASLLATPALAQDRFPSRQMRIVIPFATGGTTGAQRVLDAPADGYTLMAGTPGPITINPHLQPRLPYAPLLDFEPVVFVGASPAVITVRRDGPIRTLQDLVNAAKAAPGRLTYGSAGVGSFAHLSAELFKWR